MGRTVPAMSSSRNTGTGKSKGEFLGGGHHGRW